MNPWHRHSFHCSVSKASQRSACTNWGWGRTLHHSLQSSKVSLLNQSSSPQHPVSTPTPCPVSMRNSPYAWKFPITELQGKRPWQTKLPSDLHLFKFAVTSIQAGEGGGQHSGGNTFSSTLIIPSEKSGEALKKLWWNNVLLEGRKCFFLLKEKALIRMHSRIFGKVIYSLIWQ